MHCVNIILYICLAGAENHPTPTKNSICYEQH